MFFKRLFSRSNLKFKVNDGGRAAAGYKGQTGDCVVRSIAIVTGMTYQKVYNDLYYANEVFRTTLCVPDLGLSFFCFKLLASFVFDVFLKNSFALYKSL